MPKFIKTNLGLILLFLSTEVLAVCSIKSDQKIYIFSGAIAAAAYRLDLYQDANLKGLLSYYEFSPSSAQKFVGGIYLSQKLAEDIQDNAVIFLEESKEMVKTLKLVAKRTNKNWQLIEFKTTGVLPSLVAKESIEQLAPYLNSCEDKIQDLNKRFENYQKQISESSLSLNPVLFFTGLWNGKFPESDALVLYNQGFIKELVDNKKITTREIDGKTRFSAWSAKEFSKDNTVFIGIDSLLKENAAEFKFTKIDSSKYQVQCFACLIPGIFQLEWLATLMQQKL